MGNTARADRTPPTAPYVTYNGSYSAVWRALHLRKAGPNTITAKAVDAVGNRSAASNAQAVTGYTC